VFHSQLSCHHLSHRVLSRPKTECDGFSLSARLNAILAKGLAYGWRLD
jgi:hypothetical protein